MESSVSIPGTGKKVDRRVVLAVIAAGAVAVGFLWYRRSGGGGTPSTEDVLIDPATGLPYDTATGAGGYVNPNPHAIGAGDVDESTTPDTNVEWADLATSKLIELGIAEAGAIASAIGKYLASVPLTSDEAQIIRQAWAYAGKPPGGPSTYTLVTTQSSPGQHTPVPRRPPPTYPQDPGPGPFRIPRRT